MSAWSGVPTQFWRMLEHPDFDSFDLSSLTLCLGRRAVPARAHPRAQREDPDRAAVERIRHERVDGRGHACCRERADVTHRESVGAPYPTIEIQIRDDDRTVLPEGEVGEICLRARGRLPGLLGRSRRHRRGARRRALVPQRRLRAHRRRRALARESHARPHPARRREHLPDGDRAPADRAPRHRRRRGHRRRRTAPSGRRSRRSSSCTRARRSNRRPCRSGWGSRWPAFKVPAYVEFRDSLAVHRRPAR